MFALLAGAALAATAVAEPAKPSADACAGDPNCRHASAAELFAAADALASAGDLGGAEKLLIALTQDPHPELRAEARFRLAAVRETRGDLAGAASALRALLAEKPDAQRARLELSRILARQGNDREARRELRRAEEIGLPNDVARTVRRFSSALDTLKKRGASVEVTLAADSNVNRSTSDKFVNTIIAPFELDPNARRQSGLGTSLGAEAWSRDTLAGVTMLTRGGVHADLFAGKSQFNDIQASLGTGPEFVTGRMRIHPAFLLEHRWYGGRVYSDAYGGSLNWLARVGEKSQLEFDGSIVDQSIHDNAFLDGMRYALAATLDHNFTPETSARFTLSGAALDAKARAESLRQGAADALVAHSFDFAVAFVEASYTLTSGRAPVLLFGKTRHDHRLDFIGGVIAHRHSIAGFAPLFRLLYTDSHSTLALYDYRRVRAEVGLRREF